MWVIRECSIIEDGNLVLKKVLRRALDLTLTSSLVQTIFGLSFLIRCSNSTLYYAKFFQQWEPHIYHVSKPPKMLSVVATYMGAYYMHINLKKKKSYQLVNIWMETHL